VPRASTDLSLSLVCLSLTCVCLSHLCLSHLRLSVSLVRVCFTCVCLFHLCVSVSLLCVCLTCVCLCHFFVSLSLVCVYTSSLFHPCLHSLTVHTLSLVCARHVKNTNTRTNTRIHTLCRHSCVYSCILCTYESRATLLEELGGTKNKKRLQEGSRVEARQVLLRQHKCSPLPCARHTHKRWQQ